MEKASALALTLHMWLSYTQVLCCSVLYSAPPASSNPIIFLLLRPFIFKTLPTDFNAHCATLFDSFLKPYSSDGSDLMANRMQHVFFFSLFPSCWIQSVATAAPRWRWRGINDVWPGRFFAPSHPAPHKPAPALRDTKHTWCLAGKKK